MPSTRSVKNPKRQFSRRNRRRDLNRDPDNTQMELVKHGFFAQHKFRLIQYAVVLCLVPWFIPKTLPAMLVFIGAGLLIPVLWAVSYRRTQRLILAHDDESDDVTETVDRLT